MVFFPVQLLKGMKYFGSWDKEGSKAEQKYTDYFFLNKWILLIS